MRDSLQIVGLLRWTDLLLADTVVLLVELAP